MDKKWWCTEFIVGIVVGLVLTFIGGYIQHSLNLKKEKERRLYHQTTLLTDDMSKRYYTGSNVISNSGGNKFSERWELYMYEGVNPWNIKKNQYIDFMSTNFIDLKSDFDEIDVCFLNLHDVLNDIRIKQNPQTDRQKKELKNAKDKARKLDLQLRNKINSFQQRLFELVEN